MLTFAEHTTINEAFTSPAPWDWVYRDKSSVYLAHFQVDDLGYVAKFDYASYSNPPFWQFSFGLGKDTLTKKGLSTGMGIVGDTGAQMRVFSTAIAILKAFLQDVRPARLEFEADRNEPSRVKLYDRLTKMVASAIPGYVGRVWGKGKGEYTLIRK